MEDAKMVTDELIKKMKERSKYSMFGLDFQYYRLLLNEAGQYFVNLRSLNTDELEIYIGILREIWNNWRPMVKVPKFLEAQDKDIDRIARDFFTKHKGAGAIPNNYYMAIEKFHRDLLVTKQIIGFGSIMQKHKAASTRTREYLLGKGVKMDDDGDGGSDE